MDWVCALVLFLPSVSLYLTALWCSRAARHWDVLVPATDELPRRHLLVFINPFGGTKKAPKASTLWFLVNTKKREGGGKKRRRQGGRKREGEREVYTRARTFAHKCAQTSNFCHRLGECFRTMTHRLPFAPFHCCRFTSTLFASCLIAQTSPTSLSSPPTRVMPMRLVDHTLFHTVAVGNSCTCPFPSSLLPVFSSFAPPPLPSPSPLPPFYLPRGPCRSPPACSRHSLSLHCLAQMVRTMDLGEFDGVVCVSGDGLLFEVVNGLMAREDAAAARAMPVAIVPAGVCVSEACRCV